MKEVFIDVIPDDVDHHVANIHSSKSRKLPSLKPISAHGLKWFVVAGGPSLKNEIGKIRKGQRKGAIVVSMNGTHDYLLANGIKPDAFILADAKPVVTKFLTKPQKGTVYYIGSYCHPTVFDVLEGFDVRLWHPQEYRECEFDTVQIGGGCTVGLRSLNIGHALGFRNFHLFGFDGCVKETHHAYDEPAHDDVIRRKVYFDGKPYVMTDWMIAQAQDFKDFLTMFGNQFVMTVHSPGIIKDMCSIYQESKCRTVN